MQRPCDRCGTLFAAPKPGSRYCSRACFYAARVGAQRKDRRVPDERTCPVCAVVFLVGGRGRPPRTQILCSLVCQQRARYRRGSTSAELTAVDAAYLAGFWDGEGTIIIQWRREHAQVTVAVMNTNRAILEWAAAVTGLSVVHRHRPDTERTRETWTWALHSDAAASLLTQLRPYLKVKAAQADLAIATQERLRDPALKADRGWQQQWRDQIRELNRRGPRATEDTSASSAPTAGAPTS